MRETPTTTLVQHSGYGTNLPFSRGAPELAAAQGPNDAVQATESRYRRSPTHPYVDAEEDDRDNSSCQTTASASDPELPAVQSLICISCNVQKLAQNTVTLLEQNLDADIICIQETYRGTIKRVVSSSNPDGEDYIDTIAHHNFLCISASTELRVAVYLNKKWAIASPSAHRAIIQHSDIVCVTMHLSTRVFTFLNVYNDSCTHSVVQYLLDHSDRLLPIAFMAGDFNL